MTRLSPLALADIPGLEALEDTYNTVFGFVPNGVRIMAHRPEVVQAFVALRKAVMASGELETDFKNLIGHLASKAAGCQYCQTHAMFSLVRADEDEARLNALWDYLSSDLFSAAEKAAFDLARAAAVVPNAATDEQFEQLKQFYSEAQIAEILSVVALYGFLNRWNDSLATPIESVSAEAASPFLTQTAS